MNITRFVIRGRAHPYKLNSLIRKGFKPFDIVSRGKTLEFSELSVNERKVAEYLEELCYDYEIKYKSGIKHTVDSLLNNRGLFIGAILSLALLIICSLMVFRIEVTGVERTDIEEVNAAIISSGLRRFKLISRVDKQALKSSVLSIDGISSVSIEIRGVSIYVHIHEELPSEYIIDYDTPEPLLSQYDSIVTRIVVLTGTALVKKGDTVIKGETLIAPYISITEDDGILVEGEPIRATGIVFGRVWYRESTVVKNEEVIRERTGNYIDIASPTYIFPGNNKKHIPYTLYEVEEETVVFNAFFPLTVKYLRYYELCERKVVRNKDSGYNDIINEKYLKLRAALPPDAIIIRQWSIIKEVDNVTVIDVYLETEQRIDDGGAIGSYHN